MQADGRAGGRVVHVEAHRNRTHIAVVCQVVLEAVSVFRPPRSQLGT